MRGASPPALASLRDRLRAQLADLKMPGALEAVDAILQQVDGGQLAGPAAMVALLDAQISLRNSRRLQTAMRSSRLPALKTLADFDFSFQPSVKREQVESLSSDFRNSLPTDTSNSLPDVSRRSLRGFGGGRGAE